MSDIGLGEQVPQEPGAGPAARPTSRLRNHVNILDFQQVPRGCPGYVNRPGQRVGHLGVEALHVGYCHMRLNLLVGRVPRFQNHFFPRFNLQYRRDIGVPPVVALTGFFFKPFISVDLDTFHGS